MICSPHSIKPSPAILRGFLLFLLGSAVLMAEEQQSQGYRFEQAVIRQFTGREQLDTSYTGEWDIPAEWNKETGLPVSIKFIRWGNPIYLGDALRQRKISEPFEMVVGFYELDEKEGLARIRALHHLTIKPDDWEKWWGQVTPAEIEELSAGIKNKPLEEAQTYGREHAAALRGKSAIISINPKVNKDQRRIQCSIPFTFFYKEVLRKPPEPESRVFLLQKPFPDHFRAGARSR